MLVPYAGIKVDASITSLRSSSFELSFDDQIVNLGTALLHVSLRIIVITLVLFTSSRLLFEEIRYAPSSEGMYLTPRVVRL